MSEIHNRIINKFALRCATVTAAIHDSQQITDSLFKVIATFTTLETDSTQLNQAVAACLKNEMSAVPGSFRVISHAGVPAAVGFVRANRVSVEYTEEVAGKMKAMAKNILMSPEDESLWEVRSSGDSKYLVRQAGDNLADLVALAKVRAYNVPKLSAMATASLTANQEVVAYIDVATEEVAYAAVIGTVDQDGKEMLLCYTEGREEATIDPELVIESAFVGDAIKEIAAEKSYDLPASLHSKADQQKYWDVLFQYAPEYAQMMKDMVNQHSAL